MATRASILSSETSTRYVDLGLLLIANSLTIYWFSQHHAMWQVLITYFLQTVFVLFFYYRRIMLVNATEVSSDLPYLTQRQKVAILFRATLREQFSFIFIFFVPVALALFVIILNFEGTTPLNGASIGSEHLDYWAIALASGVFLLHHTFSYFSEVAAYWHHRIDRLAIPYGKLAVRVFTILALVFFSPLLFDDSQSANYTVFYVFMVVKTVLDIALSASSVYLQDLWIGRSR